jgi:hypothetical protein
MALKKALVDLGKHPSEVVMVFDIGVMVNGADKIEGSEYRVFMGEQYLLLLVVISQIEK